MKYVPLYDVKKILIYWDMNDPCVEQIKKQVISLPNIDLSIIDEMIDENLEYPENDHNIWYRSSLKELKERLSLNK